MERGNQTLNKMHKRCKNRSVEENINRKWKRIGWEKNKINTFVNASNPSARPLMIILSLFALKWIRASSFFFLICSREICSAVWYPVAPFCNFTYLKLIFFFFQNIKWLSKK